MRYMFESSVNSEGIETLNHATKNPAKFESSVNSEGIETRGRCYIKDKGLRAV